MPQAGPVRGFVGLACDWAQASGQQVLSWLTRGRAGEQVLGAAGPRPKGGEDKIVHARLAQLVAQRLLSLRSGSSRCCKDDPGSGLSGDDVRGRLRVVRANDVAGDEAAVTALAHAILQHDLQQASNLVRTGALEGLVRPALLHQPDQWPGSRLRQHRPVALDGQLENDLREVGAVVERHGACEALVQNHADRPDVHLFVEAGAAEDLGCHVVGRAAGFGGQVADEGVLPA
mmetsp:Transcript_31598/g.89717  ORF Transcript_31598/g.89717 Transcript_31598/m.89717 type:complete len:231 (-) Transcript_31598:3916-4608(-)